MMRLSMFYVGTGVRVNRKAFKGFLVSSLRQSELEVLRTPAARRASASCSCVRGPAPSPRRYRVRTIVRALHCLSAGANKTRSIAASPRPSLNILRRTPAAFFGLAGASSSVSNPAPDDRHIAQRGQRFRVIGLSPGRNAGCWPCGVTYSGVDVGALFGPAGASSSVSNPAPDDRRLLTRPAVSSDRAFTGAKCGLLAVRGEGARGFKSPSLRQAGSDLRHSLENPAASDPAGRLARLDRYFA